MKASTIPAQLIEKKPGWGYDYLDVAFPVTDVPGCGYRTFSVARAANPGTAQGPVSSDGYGAMENEFFKVQVEQMSGAIVHLIDKRTSIELVPAGERLGVLEYLMEAPHGMSAWTIGAPLTVTPLLDGGTLAFPQRGPYLASVRSQHRIGESTLTLTISLAAGVPRVDFTLEAEWLERGTPEKGIPMLKVAFPLAVRDGVASYEVANGFVSRSTNPEEIHSFSEEFTTGAHLGEVPALKWADLTGVQEGIAEPVGCTMLNDSKYGHSTYGNFMRLTLLRSTHDPDPLPELGKHTIRFALRPHIGNWTPADAARAGNEFNTPLNLVGTTQQTGSFPARQGFVELLTPNVLISGMKQAEDSNALILRLYEIEGKATTAQVKFHPALAAPDAPAVETDTLEVPLATNSARMAGGVLSVDIPAFGVVTVKIG